MRYFVFLITGLITQVSHVFAQQEQLIRKLGVLSYHISKADLLNTRKTNANDILSVDYRMAIGSTDSILYETFTTGSTVNIPANHPNFLPVFLQAQKGDQVSIMVSADSFYQKTMLTPLPNYINKGDSIHFYFKVYDVSTEKEFAEREVAKELHAIQDDSIALHKYLQSYNRLYKTKKGVYFVVSAAGDGTPIRVANKVTIKYRAYLYDGKVFERNTEGFTFMVGAKQVIEGLEDGVRQMSLGARYKLIIPQHLAYGASGTQVIPPFCSVIFDVEVIKVE